MSAGTVLIDNNSFSLSAGTVLIDNYSFSIYSAFITGTGGSIMARQARQLSKSGYLHLIVRGIGKQILFEDREDRLYFLSILERFCTETGVRMLAYCLMENHVHILAVFRYILTNPEKAGLGFAADYEWSSFSLYGETDSFVDTSLFSAWIGSRDEYFAFLYKGKDDDCMEYESPRRDDEWAKAVIRKHLHAESGTVLQSYDRERRDAAIRELKSQGLSIRQLERLTGINRGVIQKA